MDESRGRLIRLAVDGDPSAIESLCREFARRGLWTITEVWLLIINHRHGSEHFCAANEELIQDSLYEYVEQYWDEEIDGDIPASHEEAIKTFFDWSGESYNFKVLDLRLR